MEFRAKPVGMSQANNARFTISVLLFEMS